MGRRRLQRRGDNVRQPISFLSPNRLFLCAVLSWFRSFLWVFRGFPLCFRCFLTVFCGFRCTNLVPLSQSPCFSGISRCFSRFSALFLGIFRYFFVFWVLSSVFSMFSVGFRCISITLAATNRPDCALRLPEAKRHRQSFHQHTQIWSTNTPWNQLRHHFSRRIFFLANSSKLHPGEHIT